MIQKDKMVLQVTSEIQKMIFDLKEIQDCLDKKDDCIIKIEKILNYYHFTGSVDGVYNHIVDMRENIVDLFTKQIKA